MTTKKAKRRNSSDYKDFLSRKLLDPETAAGYLTAAFAEGEAAFLLAIKDVAEATGGMAPLARAAKLNREGLYDMLSEQGNPRLSSLCAIIEALGMQLEFSPVPRGSKAA